MVQSRLYDMLTAGVRRRLNQALQQRERVSEQRQKKLLSGGRRNVILYHQFVDTAQRGLGQSRLGIARVADTQHRKVEQFCEESWWRVTSHSVQWRPADHVR